jgi:nucleoside phosphorylase
MLAALNAALAWSNTVGIIVALKCEADAVKTAFQECGARVGEPDADGKIEIQHSDFRAVMRQGKSNLDCCSATRDLLDKDEVRCVIMSGVAGSLGTDRICQTSSSNESNFVGPKLGDVIVAVSLAPWRIRDKVRNEIENAPVPLAGNVWKELPVDPLMFRLAHQAASEVFSEGSGVTVHEGLIVSGTGIKDDPAEKAMILNEWPSGKAVEEEGWVVAALCMLNNKPCIVVRSISDLAQGDKIRAQQISGSDNEENKQATAAEHAAKVAFRTAQLLSAYW